MESTSTLSRFKRHVHLLFDVPASSKAATYMSAFIILCILGSTVSFCLESLPEMEGYTNVWMGLEVFFVAVFSSEYICRFLATPLPKCKFFWEPFNLVDILAIMPFYLELILSQFFTSFIDLRVLRVVRLVRVFRLFKVGKYSTNMQLIVRAMSRSSEALVLLLFFLIVALVLFGAVMYFVEQGKWNPKMQCYVRDGETSCSPFESIPKSFYWGITTMTTVGYGDALPTTDVGRVIVGISMVCGILVIALPVTMLGNMFVDAYAEISDELMAAKLKEEIETEDEIHLRLYETSQDFEHLKQKSADLLPRLKQIIAASLVASNRCAGAKDALQSLEPSFDLIHKNLDQSIVDMKEYMKTVVPGRTI